MTIPELCPQCGKAELSEADEGRFPSCPECGFEQYDADTLDLIAEVKREQKLCKQVLGEIPTYQDAVRLGLAK